jgi:hypothetical protein
VRPAGAAPPSRAADAAASPACLCSDITPEVGCGGLAWSFQRGLPGVLGARYYLSLGFRPGLGYLLARGENGSLVQVGGAAGGLAGWLAGRVGGCAAGRPALPGSCSWPLMASRAARPQKQLGHWPPSSSQ